MLLNKERALKIMQREGMDAIIASMPENVLYASGFQSLSQWLIRGNKTHCLVLLEKSGDLSLIAPAGELDRAACRQPFVDRIVSYDTVTVEFGEEQIWREEDRRFAGISLSANRPSNLWEALKSFELNKKAKIALDDPDLQKAFSDKFTAEIIDARPFWSECRLIKTPAELERLKKTVEVTEYGITRSMDALKEGMTEKELAIAFKKAVVEAGGEPYLHVIGAGTFGAYPNHEPGEYRIKKGDLIRWDVGCSFEGYVADFARTACLGKPTDQQQTAWDAVMAGQKAALDAVKPGIKASELYHIGMEAAKKAGLPHIRRKHLGHGIGIDMYEKPSISPGEKMLLEAGMVFELEVLYYELGFGCVQVEDTLHVTENAYECLTTLEHKLFIL